MRAPEKTERGPHVDHPQYRPQQATASAVLPSATDPMPPNEAEVNLRHMPDDDHRLQIAEQMLATWLCNVRRLRTGKLQGEFKTWLDLTEIEKNHYTHLSALAQQVIWGGK